MKHNLSTTIVEIDPAVYTAARRFFAMPDPGPGRVFLQDARSWVEKQTTVIQDDDLFDIVIHDCFSGGGVPQHIFTLEFWDGLKALMHANGVIAVVRCALFSPGLYLPSSFFLDRIMLAKLTASLPERSWPPLRRPLVPAVLSTIHSRMSTKTTTHINLSIWCAALGWLCPEAQLPFQVFFCSAAKQPLTFRQSLPADHLGSPLRQHIFSTLTSREINLSRLRPKNGHEDEETDLILTDGSTRLGQWQESQAFEHWKRESCGCGCPRLFPLFSLTGDRTVMRQVLPDVFWESY